ncbi:MAG: BatD family protein [Armatimonadetes bacterium]|nr:BatD family protein [Armatimonadota bacterium]MDW8121351.1 BatD family protein [Armatimonadota bacterium]
MKNILLLLMVCRNGIWSALFFLLWCASVAGSQGRSSVTLTKEGVTLKVYLKEPKITMGGVFLLTMETTLPGDITVPVIQAELPEKWSKDLIFLTDISDAETLWIGNQQFTKVTRIYRLAPLRSGTIRFDGLKVSVPPAYFTVPTLIGYVVSGSGIGRAEPVPQEPLKVSAVANPLTPYMGQQVVYTLRLLVSPFVDLEPSPNYEPPQAEGFFSEDYPRVVRVFSGGYDIQSVRIAFFPLKTGPLSIGSSRVLARVVGEPETRELRTNPLRLQVRPLPQPVPADFSNLVGKVQASLRIFPDRLPAGETLTIQLTLRGTAYLPGLPTPTLTIADVLSPPPREEMRKEVGPTGLLWFQRSFTWRVVPRREGKLVVPSFRFSYLDPDGGIYRVAQTKPVTVTVLKGTGLAPLAVEGEAQRPTGLIWGLGAVILVGVGAVLGFQYYRRGKWLAELAVDDPVLKQTALLLKKEGPGAVGEAIRQWIREQIYQRTGVLVSPSEKPERLQEMLTKRGVSEAAARFAREIWETALSALTDEEALLLLKRAQEVPRRL